MALSIVPVDPFWKLTWTPSTSAVTRVGVCTQVSTCQRLSLIGVGTRVETRPSEPLNRHDGLPRGFWIFH
jgi:hypothetical protein